MELIVEDTNILIDLANIGLIDRCRQLEVSFHTTDMVVSELRDGKQRQIIGKHIGEGGLAVVTLQNRDFVEVTMAYHQMSRHTNLSMADVSVLWLAQHMNCRLLSNDQKLIRHAESQGVQANGILWLTDLMVERGIVAPAEMIDYLQKLLFSNERSPHKLIMERIDDYTRDIACNVKPKAK